MPTFICPIHTCGHHTGYDCSLPTISVSPRGGDWDVTISCEHQADKPKVCACGREHQGATTTCYDCLWGSDPC